MRRRFRPPRLRLEFQHRIDQLNCERNLIRHVDERDLEYEFQLKRFNIHH
ncbi:MAG TPA: hypothetical protein VFG04_14785 [Planctomycetaceae bacterium]|nr:hypothetical protein [Planctomycetaceae bacterium]